MLVNNHHHPDLRQELRPGSMGRPMPGWSVTVLEPNRIAVDMKASPLAWFFGYHENPGATAERFSPDGRWYFTGDTGRVDAEGRFWFQSRDDDVIIMAGYRIGPFEVESVLATHPAVAECAAIAAPDELRGEALEACVVLRDGWEPSERLTAELQELVKRRYAAHAYPRAVHFLDMLPKTPSGKIQRYLLRRRRRDGLLAGAGTGAS
jgi:acetyl-CoA synthetase